MDEADAVHGSGPPDEGDFSVCLNCGQLLTFTAELALRVPTREEVGVIMTNDAAWEVIERAQGIIKRRGPLARPYTGNTIAECEAVVEKVTGLDKL